MEISLLVRRGGGNGERLGTLKIFFFTLFRTLQFVKVCGGLPSNSFKELDGTNPERCALKLKVIYYIQNIMNHPFRFFVPVFLHLVMTRETVFNRFAMTRNE